MLYLSDDLRRLIAKAGLEEKLQARSNNLLSPINEQKDLSTRAGGALEALRRQGRKRAFPRS